MTDELRTVCSHYDTTIRKSVMVNSLRNQTNETELIYLYGFVGSLVFQTQINPFDDFRCPSYVK